MDLPPFLIKTVGDGKAALVLGAGASIGAVHPQGNKPPLGQGLAKLISDQFLGGKFADQPLAVVSELAISESDLRTFQEFIAGLFIHFQPADFHRLLTTFKWHGIATLNYDLVIERAYSGSTLQRLHPVLSNETRLEEIRRSPNDLLLLKLHGCITRTADKDLPLILTPDQYLTHKRGRSRLFEVLKDWARDQTLVFVGTTLQDFDLRSILLEIADECVSRPRFYLVTPTVTDAMAKFWETKQITMLSGTFSEFLQALDTALPGIARAVPVKRPSLPVFERFSDTQPALSEQAQLFLENDAAYVHNAMASEVVDAKSFYHGFSHGWAAVKQGLDCPRDLTDAVLLDVFLEETPPTDSQLILIRAEAGAGKTVFLHRLAWRAALEFSAFCLFGRPDAVPKTETLAELCQYFPHRIYLFMDDAADCAIDLEKLLEGAKRKRLPLTVVVAERSGEWNYTCDNLVPFVTRDYQLPYLNDSETKALIDLLETHDSLGTLKGRPRDEQEDAFKKRAGRQLLVALHEATLGKPFEEIVLDEYSHIVPDAAQSMYLTICILNRSGTPVRAGLISRVHGITFETFQKQFFKPLEHVVYSHKGRGDYDVEYRARHPHIAELVFRQVLADQNLRYEKYSRILADLNVAYKTDRTSFIEMVNARTLKDLFSDHHLIERIYDIAEERNPDEGHVFLQHAIYERTHPSGSLTRAAELLNTAHKLLPGSPMVSHSYAELEVRLAEDAQNTLIREKHLKKARELISPLMGKWARGPHAHHTAFKIEHIRLKALLSDSSTPDEAITTGVRRAEAVLAEGTQRFPNDEVLIAAEADLASTLADSERAIKALEKAVAVAVDNVHIVGWLARTYRKHGQSEKAKTVLEKALEARPYDQRLNFLLGLILIEECADGTLIESHLRKAFNEGDSNYEAQFWYARQLYINGKEQQAYQRFDKFKDIAMAPKMKFTCRGEWKDRDTLRPFSGRLARVEGAYGYIERDGIGDHIFARAEEESNRAMTRLSRGQRVKFTIAFNCLGPVALNILPES